MKTKKLKEKKLSRKAAERDPKQPREIWMYVIGLVVALFAAFQSYAPAIRGPFLFDDSYLPMNVPAWANGTLLASMRGVRPLLMASYWINERLAGNDTTQYHSWNIFFHFLNALLVYYIVRKLLQLAAGPTSLA